MAVKKTKVSKWKHFKIEIGLTLHKAAIVLLAQGPVALHSETDSLPIAPGSEQQGFLFRWWFAMLWG